MIKLATWNVNSLKVRLDQVLEWLDESQTDILALQETKLEDYAFPKEAFAEAGFDVAFRGQKTYNGVAWISRFPIEDCSDCFPGFVDEQKRILAATIQDIRVINFYIPNGQSVDSDKYQYKMSWLEAMLAFIQQQQEKYKKIVIVGDFNIAPEDIDVHDPKQWEGSVLVSPNERLAFQKLLRQGFVDGVRLHHKQDNLYSWWDYRAAAFRRGMGLRIDHILVNEQLSQQCIASGIDTKPRTHSRPSDHTPVWVTLNLA